LESASTVRHHTSWRARRWNHLSLRRVVERVEVGVVVQPAALYAPSGIPFLRGVNISPGRIALDDVKYLDPAKESIAAKSRLKAGDVVVVRTGQAGAAAAVVPPELEGANCVDLLIVHPGPDLVPRYLELLINSEFVRCQVATFDGRIDPIPFQRRSTARGLASRSRCHASIRSGG